MLNNTKNKYILKILNFINFIIALSQINQLEHGFFQFNFPNY